MKNKLSLMVFIMDRSGSMAGIMNDTIGGFNSLIEEQKKLEGYEAKVTLAIFDTQYDLLYNYIDIKEVKELTNRDVYARGGTALHDAIGKTVTEVGVKLRNLPEEERPEKVIVTVFTDGEENSSKEYHLSKIKEMIKEQETKYSWVFNFIGANIDSFQDGGSLGFNTTNIANYHATSSGVKAMMRGVSNYYTSSRVNDVVTASVESFITEEEDK